MQKRVSGFFIATCICLSSFCQDSIWKDVQLKTTDQPEINPGSYRTLTFDPVQLSRSLTKLEKTKSKTFAVPLPNGSYENFAIQNSGIFHPDLEKKYPEIISLKGVSAENFDRSIRIDYSPHGGFHAMILEGKNTVYIDSWSRENQKKVISYFRKDFVRNNVPKIKCGAKDIRFADQLDTDKLMALKNKMVPVTGSERRTYKIAIAATGEYTAFHGGTVADALAAIAVTLNRVSGIYTTEVAIDFQLVANNDEIIFTNGETDPFNNDNAGVLIDQSQLVIDEKIGDANYDIGHTVSTGEGGLASLGVPCRSGSKARGVTGSNFPVGDPYDVDFVAHEIGHQFEAQHTFNGINGNCSGGNRSGSNAYEPGSGLTIMAYAGICGADNLANNSIPFFHISSILQITGYSTESTGNDCPVITELSNTPPSVSVPQGGFTIPRETPFELTGSGNDPDGDNLTYSWEQYDLGPAGEVNTPLDNAPLFRPFEPKDTSIRIFPTISDILNNNQTKGELLPDYTRDLTFRLTVRDNNPNGGGIAYDELEFSVSEDAGPFQITSQNTDTTVDAGSNLDVTWDVSNTDEAPINCEFVNIYLSTDGGNSFPLELLVNEPNDGNATVLIPLQSVTSNARIKIKASNNVFFDISDQDFTINESNSPDFSLTVTPKTVTRCQNKQASFEVSIEAFGGFSDDITLSLENVPEGFDGNFESTTINTSGSTNLSISNTGFITSDVYFMTVKATSISKTNTVSISYKVMNSPGVVRLISPGQSDTTIKIRPTFVWEKEEETESYHIQISENANFSSIYEEAQNVITEKYKSSKFLDPQTKYYWRVKGRNVCGEGEYSTPYEFTTQNCTAFFSNDLNKIISDTAITSSSLNIGIDNILTDINVLDLELRHSWMGDLLISLESPSGTTVELYDGVNCDGSSTNSLTYLAGFDDASSLIIPCPPIEGEVYQPEGNLESFNNENSIGQWELLLEDRFEEDEGILDRWGLEVCFKPILSNHEKIWEHMISVYPNPTHDIVTVTMPKLEREIWYELINSFGKKMGQNRLNNNSKINLSNFSDGVYSLKIYNKEFSIIKKVIKQ